MKKKKELILIVFTILLTVFYFTYAVTITWDSAHYMTYVEILEGILPFSSWDVVRGPVFPIIIYLSNLLFGKTVQGLLINSYIYYLIMLFFTYKIIKETLPDNKKTKKIILFTLIAIIINPIIYGYYHTLLTEFVAMTIAVLSCFLAYKWINYDFYSNKIKYTCLALVFCFLIIFSWFLKQPYISVALFPLLVAFIITILKKDKIKKKLPSVLTLVFCIIGLIFSITTWNNILEKGGLDTNSDRNPTNTLGNNLVDGLNCFEINYGYDYNNNKIEEDSFLSDIEKNNIKNHIENEDETYVVIDIKDKKDNIIDKQYVNTKNNNLSTFDSIKVILKNIIKHPILLIDSYATNYLSIIDIYKVISEDNVTHKTTNQIDLTFVNELSTIGMKPYTYTSNIFSITDEAYTRVINYEQFNHPPKILNYFMIIVSKIFIIIFKIIFLILPVTLIISIFKRIKTKNSKYDMTIILFSFSFLHTILHVATGAIIDRYLMPAYITTFLGIIILLCLSRKKKEVK